MADLAESGKVADCVDDVVRGFALRLVDDERAVERSGLWFAGHLQKRLASSERRAEVHDL